MTDRYPVDSFAYVDAVVRIEVRATGYPYGGGRPGQGVQLTLTDHHGEVVCVRLPAGPARRLGRFLRRNAWAGAARLAATAGQGRVVTGVEGPTEDVYGAARATYDGIVIVRGGPGYRPGHHEAIRAAVEQVWALAVAAGRRAAGAAVEASLRAESDRLARPGDARAVEQGIGVLKALSVAVRAAQGATGGGGR